MRAAFSLFLALFLAVAAHAFEVGGILRSVDASSRTLRVTAGGQFRTVCVSTEARILDRDGKPLPAGLKAPELKEGAEVTLTVEPEDGQPVIKAIRLGLPNSGVGRGNPAPPRVDTTRLKPLPDLGAGEYHWFKQTVYAEVPRSGLSGTSADEPAPPHTREVDQQPRGKAY